MNTNDCGRFSTENFTTMAVEEVRYINGVVFPEWLNSRNLIVTGPPGTGKSTLIRALKGWPEEGYIDITVDGWWQSPAMRTRPREFHFGVPFIGHQRAVPVYDIDQLDDSTYLDIDFMRIRLPPVRTHPLAEDFRRKLIFEFIIPPPEVTFELRTRRSAHGTHPVDEGLTLERVQEETGYYRQLCYFFHQSGMRVYLREHPDGRPRILSCSPSTAPPLHLTDEELAQWLDRIKLRDRMLGRSWSARGNRQLLELFVEMIPAVLNVERCSIFIHDKAGSRVWLQCGTGVESGQIVLDHYDSVVGQVIASGEYMVVEGMTEREGVHKLVDAVTGFISRNELCVPIKRLSGDGSAGAILVLNKLEGKYFTEQDRILLERIAVHLQAAAENLFLRQEFHHFSDLVSRQSMREGWLRLLLQLAVVAAVVEGVIIFLLVEYPQLLK